LGAGQRSRRREGTQDGRTLAVNGEGIDGCGRACSVDVAESLISVPKRHFWIQRKRHFSMGPSPQQFPTKTPFFVWNENPTFHTDQNPTFDREQNPTFDHD
jgi:hypothetical protein